MTQPVLRIVHLDDSTEDLELIRREIERRGLSVERTVVRDREGFSDALETLDPDLILSDFSIPGFSGLEALRIARRSRPETPFIFVSGALGEERAVELLREGATDYILKDRLQRLVPAMQRAKEEAETSRERRRIEEARRADHEFLEKLFDFTGVLVIVLDVDGRFLMVNEGFAKATGLTKEECVGRSVFDMMVAPDHVDQARLDHERLLAEGVLVDYEAPLRTRDGDLRLIQWTANVVSRGGERVVLASGIDLTEIKEAERERRELESQLAQAERIESLGRVAATITHEFNNVLMGIQPFAEIVGRVAGDDGKLKMCSEQIRQSIQRGSRITREVLRFARPTEPVRNRVAIGKWLETVVDSNQGVTGRGVQIRFESEKEEEIWIDPSQIEQVIVNLLLNARDALEGSGVIDLRHSIPSLDETFRFASVPHAHRYVHIEVRDDGPGIPSEILDRLFEPFFTTKHKGTGLGLAVCRQIVHAHHGHLFVESEPGIGTTFHLFLPRSQTSSTRLERSADSKNP